MLPRGKSDAMCAVYAFMRRADDIADNEEVSIETRRASMHAWLTSWHTRKGVSPVDAPVFLAVRDVQQRFGISDHLLDQLVQGTTMDLLPEPPAGVTRVRDREGDRPRTVDVYETLPALEHYCYLVASVVGLVTIRIFGFTDQHANVHAENLGKAFQFTNILRDVKEDAERGRVYLPVELLSRHGVSPQQVLSTAGGAPTSPEMRQALQELATRAEVLYKSASTLIPLLTPDSRPAMRVLVDIYHALLHKIQSSDYDVFIERASVSRARKLTLLARGFLASKCGLPI